MAKLQKSKIFERPKKSKISGNLENNVFLVVRKSRRLFLRAQIQMGESVAILFVFFILLVFGFVFYMNVMQSSAKVEVEENIQLKAIGVAQKASFLPELQCSEENVRIENCIDGYKLVPASDLISLNQPYYYDVFEFSIIRVKRIFPKPEEVWVLYNNTPANYTNKLSTFIPTSLFNTTSKEYAFGVLAVEVYRK